jgi:hypothetical protein
VPTDLIPGVNVLEALLPWRALTSFIQARLRVAALVVDGRQLRIDGSFAAYCWQYTAVMLGRVATFGLSEWLSLPGFPCTMLAQARVDTWLDAHLCFVDDAPAVSDWAAEQSGDAIKPVARMFRLFRAAAPLRLRIRARVLRAVTCHTDGLDATLAELSAWLADAALGGERGGLEIRLQTTDPALRARLAAAYSHPCAYDGFLRAVDGLVAVRTDHSGGSA